MNIGINFEYNGKNYQLRITALRSFSPTSEIAKLLVLTIIPTEPHEIFNDEARIKFALENVCEVNFINFYPRMTSLSLKVAQNELITKKIETILTILNANLLPNLISNNLQKKVIFYCDNKNVFQKYKHYWSKKKLMKQNCVINK